MSRYDRAKSDNQKIINRGFTANFRISHGKGDNLQSQSIKGFYSDTGLMLTPEGIPIVGNTISVSFHVDDITIARNSNETYEDWKLSFVNNTGQTRSGRFRKPFLDRTIGMLTVTVILDEVVV